MDKSVLDKVIAVSHSISEMRTQREKIEQLLLEYEQTLGDLLGNSAPLKAKLPTYSTFKGGKGESLSGLLYEEMASHPTLREFTFNYLCKAATKILGRDISRVSVRSALAQVGKRAGKHALIIKLRPCLYAIKTPDKWSREVLPRKKHVIPKYAGSKLSDLAYAVKKMFIDNPLEVLSTRQVLEILKVRHPELNPTRVRVDCICWRLAKNTIIIRKAPLTYTIGPDIVADTISALPH